jgi:hypothetical protein
MKRITTLLLALIIFATPAFAGLSDFLTSLNVQARTDLNGFAAKVSAQFGIPEVQVRTVISTVKEPADAFMIMQLGQWSRRPPEEVMPIYESNRGKGWGVIAKQLGIKPGSAEFHALKRGDLALTGTPGSSKGGRDDRGPGKGRGHGKNK